MPIFYYTYQSIRSICRMLKFYMQELFDVIYNFLFSIQMGNISLLTLQNNSSATIACLNYSGIQDSPYEFYQFGTEKEKKLNTIFEEVCNRDVKDFTNPKFKWIMGKMDKQWHTRFTPLYMIKCGVKPNGKMMNETEFIQAWDDMYKKQFPKYQSRIYGKATQNQKENMIPKERDQCRSFDLSVYKSLIKFVYEIDNITEINLDSTDYLAHQKKTFHKSFLDGQLKQKKTIEAIQNNKMDIFFLQEANQPLIEQIGKKFKQFFIIDRIHANCTSAIFIRKDKFPQIKDFRECNQHFIKEYFKRTGGDPEKQLNWNEDTVFQALKSQIIISTHLSSKKQKNPVQIAQMKQSIIKLKKYFPEYNIIIGGDLNGDLEYGYQISTIKNKPESIHVFPNKDTDTTVNKKRTMMQAQKNKANQLSNSVKDYIISTLPFDSCQIVTMNNIQVQKGKQLPLLPNNEHPYDHYLIVARLPLVNLKK